MYGGGVKGCLVSFAEVALPAERRRAEWTEGKCGGISLLILLATLRGARSGSKKRTSRSVDGISLPAESPASRQGVNADLLLRKALRASLY